MSDTAKRRLGDYELVELLGDGAQGKIYRARRVAEGDLPVPQGTTVALKVLREAGEDSQAFRHQVDRIINLTHPNIARYLDSFVCRDEWDNDLRCLVMEFLEGEDLHHCMQRHPAGLPWERVQSIFLQCVAGLAYACSRGVVHVDIKSSNIYLLPDGTAKVTDFGISRSESETVTAQAGSEGTFDFMAPDFITAEGAFQGDEISDIFSLGVCFYEAMTGKLPYPPTREPGLMGYLHRWQKSEAVEPEMPLRIFRVLNDRAIQFGRKCLSREREERFQSFEEMGADLECVERRSLQADGTRYVFEEYLGKGGFGEVFRARRDTDSRVFSVKHLFPSHDPVRFLREARLLREHPHQNLVAYEDFVKVERLEGDDYYLIMEFLEGMPHWSLRSRIRQEGGLDIREVVRLFSAYCDALQYLHTAHRKPVVHRDLTPANLYAPPWDPARADERRPKVFDLGIARSDKTQTGGSIPGNPEYMPPEFVLDPDFRGSPQSDLYNLGLCLYEALAGRPTYSRLPKGTTEMWQAMRNRAEGKVAMRFDLPAFEQFPRLADVVRRALQRNPRRRFASAAQMKEILVDSAESEDETMDFYGGDEDEWKTQAVMADEGVPTPAAARGATVRAAAPVRKRATGVGRLMVRLAAGVAIALVVVGAIVGGAIVWDKARRRSKLRAMRTFPESFHPAATHVGSCRKLIESTDPLEDRDVAEAVKGLCEHWSSIPGRFEQAFAKALDDGDLGTAGDVLKQWGRSVESLPFRDINLAIHGKRLASMERRVAFAGTVAELENVGATTEYATRLGDALAAAREGAEDETVKGARAWWEGRGLSLAGYAVKLPQATADEMSRLLADADGLAEAEKLVATWGAITEVQEVAKFLPDDAGKSIGNAVVYGMTRLVESKKHELVSAYGSGDEAGGEAALTWLSSSRTEYPALCRPVAALFESVAADAAKARAQFLVKELGSIPGDLAGDGLARVTGALKAVSERYARWRGGWGSDLVGDVNDAGTKLCAGIFERYAKLATAAYDKRDLETGDRNVSLLGQFAVAVPDAFGAEVLASRLKTLAEHGNAVAGQHRDLMKALAMLNGVASAFGSNDAAGWKRALDGWRAARFRDGVREGEVVRTKAKEAGLTLKRTAANVIAVSEGLDALSTVREVLSLAVDADMLEKEDETGLLALAASRETLLRLRGFEAPLSADDPASWVKALDAWSALAVPGGIRSEQAVAQEWTRLEKAFAGAVGKRIASLTAMADVEAMDKLLTRESTVAVLSRKEIQAVSGQLAAVRAGLQGLADLMRIRGSIRDGQPLTWKKAVTGVAPYLKSDAYLRQGKVREICNEIGALVATKLEAHVRQKGDRETVLAGLAAVSEISVLAREAGLLDKARADAVRVVAAETGLELVAEHLRSDSPATWLQAISDLVSLAPVLEGTTETDVEKLRVGLTTKITGFVHQRAGQVEPLQGRAQRLKEAGAVLTSAAQSGLFAENTLAAAIDAVAREGKQFVLRVVNRSDLETQVDVGGKSLGKVAAGRQSDFRFEAAGGEVPTELSAGGAFFSQTGQLVALPGGTERLQVAGWRPRPRGVDISALEGIEDLSIVYTRLRDSKQVALDEHSQLLPGEEYELLYRRDGFEEQKHTLTLQAGIDPFLLPAAGKWAKTEQPQVVKPVVLKSQLMKELEEAMARGDLKAVERVLQEMEKRKLTEQQPGDAAPKRFDGVRDETREPESDDGRKGWDAAAAKWNATDYSAAAKEFDDLAESYEQAGRDDQRNVCRLNGHLAAFLSSGRGTARRTPARAIVRLCDDDYPELPGDRKQRLDAVLARLRNYLRVSRRMAALEEVNLERDIPMVGPIPLPE